MHLRLFRDLVMDLVTGVRSLFLRKFQVQIVLMLFQSGDLFCEYLLFNKVTDLCNFGELYF